MGNCRAMEKTTHSRRTWMRGGRCPDNITLCPRGRCFLRRFQQRLDNTLGSGGRGSSVDGVGRSTTTTTTWVVPSFPGRGSCPSRGSSVSLCGSGGHICGRGKGRRVYHLAMITRDDIGGSDGVDRATIATSGGAEYRRQRHIMQRR